MTTTIKLSPLTKSGNAHCNEYESESIPVLLKEKIIEYKF